MKEHALKNSGTTELTVMVDLNTRNATSDVWYAKIQQTNVRCAHQELIVTLGAIALISALMTTLETILQECVSAEIILRSVEFAWKDNILMKRKENAWFVPKIV